MARPKLAYLKADNMRILTRTTPPATPAAGHVRAYNIAGVWYGIDDAGVITRLTNGLTLADDNASLGGVTNLQPPPYMLFSDGDFSAMPNLGARRIASFSFQNSADFNIGMGNLNFISGTGASYFQSRQSYFRAMSNSGGIPPNNEAGMIGDPANERFQIGYEPHYSVFWKQFGRLYEVSGDVPFGWSGMFTADPPASSSSLSGAGVAGFGFRTNWTGTDSDIYAVCSNGVTQEAVSMGVSIGVVTTIEPGAVWYFEAWISGTTAYFRVNGGTVRTLSAGLLPGSTTHLLWCHKFRRLLNNGSGQFEHGIGRMEIIQN